MPTEQEEEPEARPRKFRWSQPVIALVLFVGFGYAVFATKDCDPGGDETYVLDFVPSGANGAQNQAEMDRRTLSHLELAGSDLSKPTDIRHFVNVKDCDEIDDVLVRLQSAGFSAKRAGDCSVVASHTRVPTLRNLAAARKKLSEVIAGGEYTGWEAAVSPEGG